MNDSKVYGGSTSVLGVVRPAPEFDDAASAYPYASRELQGLPTRIELRLRRADKEVPALCRQLQLQEGITSRIRYVISGDWVSLMPEYVDDVLMLRAYRNPGLEASLSPRQKKALLKAKGYVAQACSRFPSDYGRALALHDELVRHSSYQKERLGRLRTAVVTDLLLEGKGVCEGYTHTYRLLLDMAGIENRYVAGKANGERHSWNLVKLEGRWIHVDCTYDDPLPDVAGRAWHSHFGLPDSMISRTHTWNRKDYPEATALSLYYPLYKGLHFRTAREIVAWCRQNPPGKGVEELFYIDELGTAKDYRQVRKLLEEAHEGTGAPVFASFSWNPRLPNVITCRF